MGKRLKKARKAVGKRIKKRVKDNKAILRRLDRIEAYLGEELHKKKPAEPAATVGTG